MGGGDISEGRDKWTEKQSGVSFSLLDSSSSYFNFEWVITLYIETVSGNELGSLLWTVNGDNILHITTTPPPFHPEARHIDRCMWVGLIKHFTKTTCPKHYF